MCYFYYFSKELELYKQELITKPAMIVINKMDVDGAEKKYDEIKDHIINLSGTYINIDFFQIKF